jgi:hypothetical protein
MASSIDTEKINVPKKCVTRKMINMGTVTRNCNQLSRVDIDRRSVGLSVLVSGTPLGPMTRFFFFLSLFSLSDNEYLQYVRLNG